MSKRNQDVKRQLFRGFTNRKSSTLDSTTQNLLSRTLRKQSDKHKKQEDFNEFIIHKTTSPEDYKIFVSTHPLRESKLQAFEQAEQAFDELFNHDSNDESGSEDEIEPDLSSIAPPTETFENDILISVPGYSKEEIIASKRFNVNDRKNIRISKVSDLERAFSSTDFLKRLPRDRLQEYQDLNHEFLSSLRVLQEDKNAKLNEFNHILEATQDLGLTDKLQPFHLDYLRDAVNSIENDAWMYERKRDV